MWSSLSLILSCITVKTQHAAKRDNHCLNCHKKKKQLTPFFKCNAIGSLDKKKKMGTGHVLPLSRQGKSLLKYKNIEKRYTMDPTHFPISHTPPFYSSIHNRKKTKSFLWFCNFLTYTSISSPYLFFTFFFILKIKS